MLSILSIIFLYWLLLTTITKQCNSKRLTGGGKISFCNDGMEGHKRRVAEFFGEVERYEREKRLCEALKDMQVGETREFEGKNYTKLSTITF